MRQVNVVVSYDSNDWNRRVHRRALLKYVMVGGVLALVSDVFPVIPPSDLLTKAYGETQSRISIQQK